MSTSGRQKPRWFRKGAGSLCLLAVLLGSGGSGFAQGPGGRSAAEARRDLAERENAVRAGEEKLSTLRKEVEEKIRKYEDLLGRMEQEQKRKEETGRANFESMVKIFESMPPEDAAARLATVDEPMAAAILLNMKSKKAGAVMSSMAASKVASLAEIMTKGVKIFPAP